jgi:hypothetical protein
MIATAGGRAVASVRYFTGPCWQLTPDAPDPGSKSLSHERQRESQKDKFAETIVKKKFIIWAILLLQQPEREQKWHKKTDQR